MKGATFFNSLFLSLLFAGGFELSNALPNKPSDLKARRGVIVPVGTLTERS